MALFALILAGGSGERFWPMSRKSRPKQLLSLFSNTTLLGETLQRLKGVVAPEHTLILTNVEQEAAVREIAHQLPAENIVAEPAKRDTAAAIALGAAWIALRDGEATMIVLPADHLISDVEGFQKTLSAAAETAQQMDGLVTIGIQPTWACPGYGYIQKGNSLQLHSGSTEGMEVCEVAKFCEKPKPEIAQQFLESGNFSWNAGMFIWRLETLLGEFEKHAPELAAFVEQTRVDGSLRNALDTEFARLPKISIDYAILEKASKVMMVSAKFDWDDVGSWASVAKYLVGDADGNASNTALTTVDSERNIVFSAGGKRVALLGVSDLVVVQSEDALLVCSRDQVERVKQIVAKLPPELQ